MSDRRGLLQPVPYETVRSVEIGHVDDRGIIRNIIEGPMEHLAFITSKAGSYRAGHFHKEGWQWCFVVSGKVRCFSRKAGKDSEVRIQIARPYDLIITPPGIAHRHEYLEDTGFVAIYDVPRLKLEEQDTFPYDHDWK